MAVRKVAVLGHPVLRKVAAPVSMEEISSPAFQELLKDMLETMFEYDGRGLAAPQIHESKQLLVMLWDFTPNEEPYVLVLINPVITPMTQEKSAFWEGCLSLPGLRGKVARPNKISVEAINQRKEKVSLVAEGFAATVIQHEVDHLLGKLYIDRMDGLNELSFNREFDRYWAKPGDTQGDGE